MDPNPMTGVLLRSGETHTETHRDTHREGHVMMEEILGNAAASQGKPRITGPLRMPGERPGPDSPPGPAQGTESAKPLIENFWPPEPGEN